MRTALIGGSLTGGPAGLQRLRELFEEALPDWATHPDVPLVQVEGPSYGFPFELLPVFDLDDEGHMDDIERRSPGGFSGSRHPCGAFRMKPGVTRACRRDRYCTADLCR
jgi:hypothetical protein